MGWIDRKARVADATDATAGGVAEACGGVDTGLAGECCGVHVAVGTHRPYSTLEAQMWRQYERGSLPVGTIPVIPESDRSVHTHDTSVGGEGGSGVWLLVCSIQASCRLCH